MGCFSCVPTVHSLVYVGLQMLVRHIVVATTYHTSEMTPKSLNVGGVNRTINNKLQLTVVTYLVIITFGVKSVVCVQLVSEDGSTLFNEL